MIIIEDITNSAETFGFLNIGDFFVFVRGKNDSLCVKVGKTSGFDFSANRIFYLRENETVNPVDARIQFRRKDNDKLLCME